MTAVYNASTGTWTQRPTPTASAPSGIMLSGDTYVRRPTADQTVSGQMERLQRGDSEYMQTNRKQGQLTAARRGLLNTSMAAQAGQQAAIMGSLPIAQADAQLASQAASQNADALNAVRIADLQRQAASATASGGSGQYNRPNALDADADEQRQMRIMRLASELNISEADADRMFRAEQGDLDRSFGREEWGWRSGESERDRGLTREEWGQRREEADRQRGFQASEAELDRDFAAYTQQIAGQQNASRDRTQIFSGMMGQIFSTLFSTPDFWADQDGARGFMDFFSGAFGDIFNQFMGGAGAGGGGNGGGG